MTFNKMEVLDTASFQREKSFYGKAHVLHETNGDTILRSYDTNVCTIKPDGTIKMTALYSRTTQRHIEAFLTLYKDKWIHKYPNLQLGKRNLIKELNLDDCYYYDHWDYLNH